MSDQRFASGQSQRGIIIFARSRSRSQSRREHGSFFPRDCERRLEGQQCTFSDNLYACAFCVSVRPRAPRSSVLSSSRAAPAMSAVPLALGPAPPAPAGASTASPAGGAGGGAPVENLLSFSGAPVPARSSLADTCAPAPTPRASLVDIMCDVASAGMNSVANLNMYLKIVGVTSLSQLCLSEIKEVMSVRLLQFGFTVTTLRRRSWPSRGRRTRTAQQPTMRGPVRSPTTSSSVSSRRPPATPLSTRARRRRGPLFRALCASPASSLLFASESPLMRRVDDSRSCSAVSIPPLRERARRLRPTTLPRAGRRRDSLHCAAAGTLATPAGRPRQARPGSFRGHQPANAILFSTVHYPHRPPAASICDGARRRSTPH
jgi:hypothetical protein